MDRISKLTLFKHLTYAGFICFMYILQTMPGFLVMNNVKPIFVTAIAVTIAMHEGEFIGGVYGAIIGLLCDSGGTFAFGFTGIFLCIACVLAGLLVLHFLHRSVVSALIVVFVFLLLSESVKFFFMYSLWNYPGSSRLYTHYIIPKILYSLLVTTPIYLVTRSIYLGFESRLHY